MEQTLNDFRFLNEVELKKLVEKGIKSDELYRAIDMNKIRNLSFEDTYYMNHLGGGVLRLVAAQNFAIIFLGTLKDTAKADFMKVILKESIL